MAHLFTLTQDILNLAQQGIDDLIFYLGKDCELIFPPKIVLCENCVYDPIGKKSGNIYISGGPIFFENGQTCKMCNGKGTRADQVTKIIKLLCHTDRKKWITKFPPNVEIPDGAIEAKGYLSDLEYILQSRVMIVQPELSSLIKWRYELIGEPVNRSNIIQNRYVNTLWKRSG